MNTDLLEYTDVLDEPEDINEPLPMAALLREGQLYTPHQLMLPNGNRFGTTFEIEDDFDLFQVSVRYASMTPVVQDLDFVYELHPGDFFTLWLNCS